MQAIQTKIIPYTNHKPMRIKAECFVGKITVHWDYSLDGEANHILAAKALMDKLGWEFDFVSGTLKDGSMVHVLIKG